MKKLHVISALLVLCVAMFFGAMTSLGMFTANASSDFAVADGAQIRVVVEDKEDIDNYGIRFIANVGETIEGGEYHMMIVPETYIEAYNTAKTADEGIPSIAKWLLDKKANFPEMPLAITGELVPNANGEIFGSLVTLKYNNLNTKFAGIGYCDVDGEIIAATMANNGLFSVVDVAENVLAEGIYDDDSDEDCVVIKSNVEKFVRLAINQKAGKTAEDETVITLNKVAEELKIAGSLQLSYQPEVALNAAKWTTSNASVASVSDGLVTAVGEGLAKITVSIAGVTATCDVVVGPDKLEVLSNIKSDYKVFAGFSGLTNVAYSINGTAVTEDTYVFDKDTSYSLTTTFTCDGKDFEATTPVTVVDLANVDFAADQEKWGLIGRFGGESTVTAGTYQDRDAVLLEGNAYLNKELINAIREAGFWTLTFDAYVTSLVESSADKTFSMQGYMPGGNIHNCSTSQEYSVGHLTISYADISDSDVGRWITFYLDISRFYDDEYILMLTTCLSSVVISNMNFHYVPQFTATDTEISNEEMQTYGKYILIPSFRGAVAGAALSWVEGGYRNNRPVDPNGYHFQNAFTLLRGYLVQANAFGKNMMNLNLQGMGATAIGAWTPDWSGNPWGSTADIGWSKTTKSIDITYAMQNKTPDGNTLNPYFLAIQDRIDYVLTLNSYNVYIQLDSFNFTEVGAN